MSGESFTETQSLFYKRLSKERKPTEEESRAYDTCMEVFRQLGFLSDCLWATRNFDVYANETVLDLGCGEGDLTASFGKGQAIGIDFSKHQVRKARKKHKASRFLVMSADCLDFEDESFDWVFAVNLLHHVPNPSKVLSEAYRVLKRGGVLVSIDPSSSNPFGRLSRALYSHKRELPPLPTFAHTPNERQFSRAEYEALFGGSEFSDFSVKAHRLQRQLFFAALLFPRISRLPFFSFFLIVSEWFGDWLVQRPILSGLGYFWIAEATK